MKQRYVIGRECNQQLSPQVGITTLYCTGLSYRHVGGKVKGKHSLAEKHGCDTHSFPHFFNNYSDG